MSDWDNLAAEMAATRGIKTAAPPVQPPVNVLAEPVDAAPAALPPADPADADESAAVPVPPASLPLDAPFDYDRLARQLRHKNLANSLRGTVSQETDAAAEAAAISERTGVPAAVVFRDLPNLRHKLASDDLDLDKLLDQAPATAAWLADQDNARVSRDEIGPLASFEKTIRAIADDAAGQFSAGYDTSTLGHLAFQVMNGAQLSAADLERFAALQQEQLLNPRPEYWTGNAAQFLGTMAPGIGRGTELGLQSSIGMMTGAALLGQAGPQAAIPEELLTVPAAGAAGFAGGFLAGVTEDSTIVNTGLAWLEYGSFRDSQGNPLDPYTRKVVAKTAGLLMGSLDALGAATIGAMAPGFRALTAEGRKRVFNAILRRPGVLDAIGRFATRTGIATATEVGTETLQEVVQIVGGELAKVIEPGEFETISGEEILGRVTTTAIETFKGAVLLGAGTSGGGLAADLWRANRARRTSQAWEAMGGAADQLKLRQRLPSKYREFVDQATAGGEVDNVFVDAGAFVTLFQSAGVDPARAAAELGVGHQLQTAIETGGDLVIPLSTYAERLAGSTYHRGLTPHLRLRADDMSGQEALDFFANLEGDIAARLDQLASDAGEETGDNAGGAAIFDDVRRQLIDAGRPADVATQEAQLFRAFFETMGTREGIDPLELYRQAGLDVSRQLPEGLQGLTDEDLDDLLGRVNAGQAEETTEGESPGTGNPAQAQAAAKVPAQDKAFLPDGGSVDIEYQLADLGELVTSHTDDLEPNPDFPASLQPRDRARAASGEQIARLAGGLIPELLGRSANVADGAPIVGADNIVESGNGRIMALRRAYGQDLETAGQYRAWLASQGYDVEGMTAPVLIRRRTDATDDAAREAFTRAANSRTTASMSASEQARADAAALSPDLLGLIRSNDLDAASNRPFVRAFLAKIGEADLGALVDKAGKLSLDGRRRIRGALLARAYGDVAMIERLLEEDDAGLGPLGRALLDVAPQWAALEDAEATAAIVEAVRAVFRQRETGQPLHFALQQMDMLGDGISAAGRAFMGSFLAFDRKGNSRLRGRDKIRDLLDRVIEELEKRDPDSGPDMLGEDPTSVAAIVETVAGKGLEDMRSLLGELDLDPETVTAADIRASTKPPALEDAALFQLFAWHGSPHTFDRFTTAAIGSGEGAQVYGWGLYFASRRGIADHYRKVLSQPTYLVDGEPAKPGVQGGWIKTALQTDNPQGYISTKIDHFKRALRELQHDGGDPTRRRIYELELEALEGLVGKTLSKTRDGGGRLFEVELAPTEEELLDWDQRDQSPEVRAILDSMELSPVSPAAVQWTEQGAFHIGRLDGDMVVIVSERDDGTYHADNYQATGRSGTFNTLDEAKDFAARNAVEVASGKGTGDGRSIYKRLAAMLGSPQEASNMLRELGIRGIKYADAASRDEDTDEPTHNYVIFDERDVDVVSYHQSARVDDPDLADLLEKLDAGADPTELAKHPAFEKAKAAAAAIPETQLADGYGSEAWQAARLFDFDGEQVTGYEAGIARLVDGAKAFAGQGGVKNERKATILLGPPASGKSTVAELIAERDGAAIVDPDEAKKALPEYGDGTGANAVHHESKRLALEVGDRLIGEGANLVIPKVGGNPESIERIIEALKGEGYEVNVELMQVDPAEAFARMVRRFYETGRLINPTYMVSIGSKTQATYIQIKEKGVANGFAIYDNAGPPGSIPKQTETLGTARKLARPGARRPGAGERNAATDESSPEGTPGRTGSSRRVDPLRQDNGEPRGSITFTEGKAMIRLFDKADLSTVLHEGGHLFLEIMRRLASRPDATPQIRADYATIADWLGMKSASSPFGRDHHEQFARGVEAYLMEGKAPSSELQRAFDRFRAWLQRIYRTVAGLNVELTDEVRRSFDRMFATDEQIRAAEAAARFSPLFPDPDSSGMTPAEHALYMAEAAKATKAAEADLLAKAMGEIAREKTAAWKADEATVRAAVIAEVDARPVYQAIRIISNPGDGMPALRISRAAVEAELGKDAADRLAKMAVPPLIAKGGVAPDDAALATGYGSGRELLEALLAAPKRSEVIEAETTRQMRARHGDILTDGTIEAEAQEAAFSDERATFLLTELRALNRRAGNPGELTPLQVIKQAAARFVAGSRISAILRPGHHMTTSQRAANRATEAVAAGDYKAAAIAKRDQLFHFEAWRAATQAADDVEAGLRKFAKFANGRVRQRIRGRHLDQIDAILERIDFRKSVSARQIARRQSLAEYITEQEDVLGLQVNIDPRLRNEAFRQHYKAMSVEDFRAVVDAVDQLEHLASLNGRLLAARDQRDFEAAVTAITTSIADNNELRDTEPDFAPGRFKSMVRGLRIAAAAHTKIEFLFERLDGFTHGAVWQNLFRPIADAEAEEKRINRRLIDELGRTFDAYSRLERARWYTRRIHVAPLGKSFTKASLLSLALNWGNEGNRKAVLDGYGWTAAQVEQALDQHLDHRDWQTVQRLWDLVDTLWPDIEALQYDLTGSRPPKVEASPVNNRFGTFRGGYYPLIYDGDLGQRAFERSEKQQAQELFGGNHVRPATRKGHTIARVGSGKQPVKLDLSVLTQHLTQAVHDLTHRRAVSDALRLIRHKDVHAAIEGAAGQALYRELVPWLRAIAAPTVEPVHAFEKILSRARTGTTIVNMGLKVTTALAQPFGWFQTVAVLGPKRSTQALWHFVGHPSRMGREIREILAKSEAMRTRQKTFDRDVADTINRLTRAGPLSDVQASYFWMTGLLDMLIAVPTWRAGYTKGLEDNGGDEAAAVAYADSMVRMTQSAGGPKDLARVQRGSEFHRMLTLFYSYFSVLYNLLEREGRKTDFTRPGDYPRFVGSMFALWIAPAILTELAVGRGPDEDEDWATWSAKKIAGYPFAAIVGVRDIASALLDDYGYEISPIVAAFEGIARTGKDLAEGDGFSRSEVKNAFLLGATWGQLPGRQMWMTGEYLFDWMTGETEPESIGEALKYLFLQRRPGAYQG